MEKTEFGGVIKSIRLPFEHRPHRHDDCCEAPYTLPPPPSGHMMSVGRSSEKTNEIKRKCLILERYIQLYDQFSNLG